MNQPLPEERILDLIRQDSRASTANVRGRLIRLFSLARMYRLSVIMCVIAGGCFISSWFADPAALFAGKSAVSATEWVPLSLGGVGVEDYLEDIAKRDILRHHEARQRAGGGELVYADSLKNMTLAGIVIDEPMQAVLKDESTGNVLYVTAGATFGDITVVSIEEGKVVLEYGGEKIELRM